MQALCNFHASEKTFRIKMVKCAIHLNHFAIEANKGQYFGMLKNVGAIFWSIFCLMICVHISKMNQYQMNNAFYCVFVLKSLIGQCCIATKPMAVLRAYVSKANF